jgi:hypothetical protein
MKKQLSALISVMPVSVVLLVVLEYFCNDNIADVANKKR